MPTRWHRRSKIKEEESTRPSEEELLNRVIQAKCMEALIGGRPVRFKTRSEDLIITPEIARKMIRLARSRSKPKL